MKLYTNNFKAQFQTEQHKTCSVGEKAIETTAMFIIFFLLFTRNLWNFLCSVCSLHWAWLSYDCARLSHAEATIPQERSK